MRTLRSAKGATGAGQHARAAARDAVWAKLRAVARPDSRFHWDFSSFIADFDGSEYCVDRVRALAAWSRSPRLFITPDNSTELVRRAALADSKPFVMSTYGIRRGLVAVDPGEVPETERSYAATLDGMDRFARPIDLASIRQGGRIGLLITGASAVSLSGHRIGKGHGYFDLEWALLSEIGVTGESSQIAAVVHDCQLVDTGVAATHDVPVDWIITPTRTLRVDAQSRPPGRVRWDLLRGTELETVPPAMELAALQGRASPGEAAAAAHQASSGHDGSHHHLPVPVGACSPAAAQSGPRPGRSAWQGDSRYGQQRLDYERGGSDEHDRCP